MSQDTESQYQLISQLQRELEELRDKYDTLSSDTNVIKLEREELKTELEQIKNENQELSEKNTELQQLTETMEMERNHLLRPTLDQLQTFDEDKTELKSQLAEQQENMKKLNTLNSQIQEENEKYKLGLEKYDSQLRKKEENSQTRINTLTAQIQQLQIDNEELNKKLLKSELDLYAMRKHRQSLQDEEKDHSPLLKHMQSDTVEIEVTDLEGLFDVNKATDNAEHNDQDTPTMQPVILSSDRSTSNVNSRKTSIVLTLHDLASVMGKTEYHHHRRNTMGSLQSIDSGKDVFNNLKRVLLNKKSEVDVVGDIDGDELILNEATEEEDVVSDLEQEDDGKDMKRNEEILRKEEEIKKKDEEIERLKMENKQMVQTHVEIQETLKIQIERKDKEIADKKSRIENLREQKRTLEMKMAKKSCNLIPWCSN